MPVAIVGKDTRRDKDLAQGLGGGAFHPPPPPTPTRGAAEGILPLSCCHRVKPPPGQSTGEGHFWTLLEGLSRSQPPREATVTHEGEATKPSGQAQKIQLRQVDSPLSTFPNNRQETGVRDLTPPWNVTHRPHGARNRSSRPRRRGFCHRGAPSALHKLTFSPWREGTESRRLWKLSLMWSLRLRSSAL